MSLPDDLIQRLLTLSDAERTQLLAALNQAFPSVDQSGQSGGNSAGTGNTFQGDVQIGDTHGPQVGAVQAGASVFIATAMTFQAPPGSVSITPEAVLAQLHAWKIAAPETLVQTVDRLLVRGMLYWPGTPVLPPAGVPESPAWRALLCWPLISATVLELPSTWVDVLLALEVSQLRALLLRTRTAFLTDRSVAGRERLALTFAAALRAPAYLPDLARLIQWLTPTVPALLAAVLTEPTLLEQDRRAAQTLRALDALLRIDPAQIGLGVGGTLAVDAVLRGGDSLLSELLRRLLTPTATTQASAPIAARLPATGADPDALRAGEARRSVPPEAARVEPAAGESSPDPPTRSRGPLRLSIPVTATEWQAAWQQHDDTFGAHGLNHTPVPYWCCVPGGRSRIGGWERGAAHADLHVPAFWIARVPITVAQFAPFVRTGYTDPRYWTPHGWRWRQENKRTQPWYWNEANFKRPAQPVVGVTWFEADAYCAWLDAQLRAWLPPGYALRLPTEAEWEVAASWDGRTKRTSPWGAAAPTPERAVYDRNWNDGPPDVGTCPAGAAACGALDMAGTVWEVCTSSYERYPTGAQTGEKGFTTDTYDVPWRGGGYWNDSTSVRCGARYGSRPVVLSHDDGVRVVVARSLA